jgi:hypothetical protein
MTPDPVRPGRLPRLSDLKPKTGPPGSARILDACVNQAQGQLGLGADGGRLGWLVASTVVVAALQRAVDESGSSLFLLKGGTLLQHRLGLVIITRDEGRRRTDPRRPRRVRRETRQDPRTAVGTTDADQDRDRGDRDTHAGHQAAPVPRPGRPSRPDMAPNPGRDRPRRGRSRIGVRGIPATLAPGLWPPGARATGRPRVAVPDRAEAPRLLGPHIDAQPWIEPGSLLHLESAPRIGLTWSSTTHIIPVQGHFAVHRHGPTLTRHESAKLTPMGSAPGMAETLWLESRHDSLPDLLPKYMVLVGTRWYLLGRTAWSAVPTSPNSRQWSLLPRMGVSRAARPRRLSHLRVHPAPAFPCPIPAPSPRRPLRPR